MSESPEPKRPTVHHIPIKCDSPTEKRQITALHAPVPAPPVDDMKPQNISFIGKCLSFLAIQKRVIHNIFKEFITFMFLFSSSFRSFIHMF